MGWASATSAAALKDRLPCRDLPETPGETVAVALSNEALTSPVMDSRLGDLEACSNLARGKHAAEA